MTFFYCALCAGHGAKTHDYNCPNETDRIKLLERRIDRLEECMIVQNPIELTVYLVGKNEDDALGNMPFDGPESAESFQLDNPGTKIFSVTAYIDPTTIEDA